MGASQSLASASPTSGFASPGALLLFYLGTSDAWAGGAEQLCASVCLGALGFFALAFSALSCFAGESEVRLARRVALLEQFACALLVLRWLAQAYFDAQPAARLGAPLAGTWPAFAGARPAAGALLATLGLLANTHHYFRWLAALAQPALVAFELVNAVALEPLARCRASGACTGQATGGLSAGELVWLQRLQLAGAALGVTVALCACALLSIIGAAGPRLPVRLFDTTRPLAMITHKARKAVHDEHGGAEAEAAFAAAKASGGFRTRGALKGAKVRERKETAAEHAKITRRFAAAFNMLDKAVRENFSLTSLITHVLQ
jgi:hypothetical protein